MVNMRQFNDFERRNQEFLVNLNVKFTQVEVTSTGLKKSILDSTAPMRTYFYENGVHDYTCQSQGETHKVFKNVSILTEGTSFDTKASFYRPSTKKGDPRMWIYGLGKYTDGSDIHVLFWYDDNLYTINITHIDIEQCYNSPILNPIQDVLKAIHKAENSVSEELLDKFRSVKDDWFPSEVEADTGIGRAVESFLGIPMNSDKTPDYKGIELKSHRDKRSSNKNVLFTQAPDWDLSAYKSGREIVDKFGYLTPEGEKTYRSTVQCLSPNKQMLYLNVNQLDEHLELQAKLSKVEDVAVWRLMKLHERLQIKHHETFWIEVDNRKEDGKEFFQFKQIEHTRNPNVGQFDVLLEQKFITLDLLLCRPKGNGKSGHGDVYSFKIKRKGMPLLFPEKKLYIL